MLVAGGAVTLISGRNPLMMLATALASIMTVVFTVTQYLTERKERLNKEKYLEENYQSYLTKTTSIIDKVHREEQQILHYQQPSPLKLLSLIENYDSRLYERMTNNKDFLAVSLGTGTEPSSITIDSEYNLRDEGEWARHTKNLIETYSYQEDVPIVMNLRKQTLGLVGNYDVLKDTVSNLFLQMIFFQSYRDINFITLVPQKSYVKDWHKWRLLPHFKMQEINTRGIVHNAKTRDVILSNLYQIINSRKQKLKEASYEKSVFMPHLVLTIFDDSYLAGHGLNEFLSDDMSDLGVTVIWCKEDKKLLPETITSLVEIKSQQSGVFIQDNESYLNKPFTPYPKLETRKDFEVIIRQIASLEHMEIEKNAVPESLSLLEQYLVETTEELNIAQRWAVAEPSKSIASLIGWKGKKEFAFWDLHEQVHGPHAIIGGTSGSGKSEFLTTFLIGLAINFSPEDIGMLIIDWKGGGIADTLKNLPHFMGSITNLDGAGTARALASINAELKKRQREFRKYGVSNIAGYTKLYREREKPREGVKYPSKPLPHLMLVSDEFAELKENVPEFLDELTSVARIGRSLGVHLILATQKPDGVVNDQIDANAKSKVALKMSDESNSKTLIKTGDAAHITNAGRGYLRVGESEVYELFQSGYGGVEYQPDAKEDEIQDERIYNINDSGQWELIYNPHEDIINQELKEDLPTQLEAVISEIETNFKALNYKKPDKPWLPNLAKSIPTKKVKLDKQHNLTLPLGLLDIPKLQTQEVYNYNLEEATHTVIFSSPGFGKSITLQTIIMNLARENTPDQVQFNLLDFGTNGLLPLRDLPHVADIVTLEENEKLQKMLDRIGDNLAERKALLKKEGVANLKQYQAKTNQTLPVIVNILDSYDGLSQNDRRKDNVDNILMSILREGAAMGIYLIMTAGRYNAIRMNMLANLQTKIALFLNEEGDLNNLFGREKLTQVEIPGRAQIKLEEPLALQIYLPNNGENEVEILESTKKEVNEMKKSWDGETPNKIPMVPDELDFDVFEKYISENSKSTLFFGLNKINANTESFELFKGQTLGLFPESPKQASLVYPFLIKQLLERVPRDEIVIIDANNSLETLKDYVSLYVDKKLFNIESTLVKEALENLLEKDEDKQQLVIISGISDVFEKIMLTPNQVSEILGLQNKSVQLIFIDNMSRIANNYAITSSLKDNLYQILFGGDLNNQRFINNLSMGLKKELHAKNVLHSIKDDELFNIVVPVEKQEGE